MLCRLLCLAIAAVDEAVWFFDALEVTAEQAPAGDDHWRTLVIGQPGEQTRWVLARATLEFPSPPESGSYLLRIGPGRLVSRALFNGTSLQRASDPMYARAIDPVGSMFHVPSELLTPGTNHLELDLAPGEGPTRLEQGPAYLLAPSLARRFFELLGERPRFVVANQAALTGASEEGTMAQRVLFRRDADPRLYAVCDLTLVDGDREIPTSSLAVPEVECSFPILTLRAKDPGFTGLYLRQSVFAPLSLENRAVDRWPALLGTIGNFLSKDSFSQLTYRVRLYPQIGGPLVLHQVGDCTLLANEAVGLFVTHGAPIVADRPTLGLSLTLTPGAPSSGRAGTAMMGPGEDFGIVLRIPEESWEETLERYLGRVSELRAATSTLSGAWIVAPDLFSPERHSARARAFTRVIALNAFRHRDALCPEAGRAAPERFDPRLAYWSSLFWTLHDPDGESRLLRLTFESVDAQGHVQAFSSGDPSGRDQVSRNLYSILRLLQWHEWHGDPQQPLVAEGVLEQVLASCRDAGALPRSLELVRAAAHRKAAVLLARRGKAEAAAQLEQFAAAQLERIFRPVAEGGYWLGDALSLEEGEDPLAVAEGLTLGIVPESLRESLLLSLFPLLPPEASALSLTGVLALRAGLQLGFVHEVKPFLAAAQEWMTRDVPIDPTLAAWYGTVVHGLWGVSLEDPQRIEILPRAHPDAPLSLRLPTGSGTLGIQLSRPDAQLFRSLQLHQDGPRPREVRFGIIGRLGTGRKIQIGQVTYSLYDFNLPPRGRQDTQVR